MLIFDVEIKRAILGKNETPIPDIEYCNGWRDFANMGISVICAYDYREERYGVFCEDNLGDFADLVASHDLIVGFNSLAFDNPLCFVNGINVPGSKSYDILVEVWKAAGLSPEFQYPSHLGFGLDAICQVNLGVRKTGNGAHAMFSWQRGRIGAVIDYCLNDVRMTKLLLDRILSCGCIRDPRNSAAVLEIRRPA